MGEIRRDNNVERVSDEMDAPKFLIDGEAVIGIPEEREMRGGFFDILCFVVLREIEIIQLGDFV
jgi:hypothetical protein